jgi:DNA-binding SARP family transcriptional activator/TolB-like protein
MAETARVVPLRAGATAHRVKVLGGFRLTLPDGSDTTPKARKTRALLAFLLVTRQPWTRERLANLLWSDRADEQAKASLRQALYELRDFASGPDALLVVKRDEVAARAEAFALDLDRVTDLARRGDVAGLAAALDGGQLDLLADLDGAGRDFDEWLDWERRQAREKLLSAAVEAGEGGLAAGVPAEARRLADALEGLDGLNEPAVRLGLAADRAVGDLSALHRRYERFARRLKSELDTEPAAETQALLRDDRPSVTAPSSVPPVPTEHPPLPGPTRRKLWPWIAALVVIVALAAAFGWTRLAQAPPARSLAVLPFKTGAAQPGYYGAGVSEAVSNLLARDKTFEVLGAVSARQFGAAAQPIDAARRLGVGYVLEGEVRVVEGRTDVHARLVRVRDGRAVWRARYQRPVADIFAVQNEIAAAVAQTVGARITARDNPHLKTRPEVYDRYLQARSLARERRVQPLQEARRLLLEAAALDPDFAPGFATLAQVTMLLSDHPTSYGVVPVLVAQDEARRYAQRAMQLAPELGEAYAAYGLLSMADAESLPFYARAVTLDPQRPDFHRWLGQAYSSVGREADALAEFQRAAALDPLSWLSAEHVVGQLFLFGRNAEAQAAADRFARISNDPHGVARVRVTLAREQGRLADYVRLSEDVVRRWPERSPRGDHAKAWLLLGERQRAMQALGPDQPAARAALAGDGAAVARETLRMGRAFWETEPGFWDLADTLVLTGHGAALLTVYDAEFKSVDEFYARASAKVLPVGPPLIAAMTEAGRADEAKALAARLLQRVDADARMGVAPAVVEYERAQVLALTGRRDEAVAQLAASVNGHWMRAAWPGGRLVDRVAFRGLRDHPGMAAVEAKVDGQIDAQRALLGLASLKN